MEIINVIPRSDLTITILSTILSSVFTKLESRKVLATMPFLRSD